MAAFASTRPRGAGWAALLGLGLSVAASGTLSAPLPGPAAAALGAAAWGLAAAFLLARTWPPLAGEAARKALWVALPAAGWLLEPFRGLPLPERASLALAALAGASLLLAEGSRGNADAGWRRAAGWSTGVAGCAGLFVAGTELVRRLPEGRKVLGAVAASAAVLLAWVPAAVSEWSRTKRELAEEVALGLLPAEDAAVLAVPWRRVRERRFGRPDERREYVRSALLLAVVRRQQTRRSGEAIRLRQLEVLAFRTRVRRTLEARAGRWASASGDELPALDRES